MLEKSSGSNVWLARRRRDSRMGEAEPCSDQLRVDAPEARQRAGQGRRAFYRPLNQRGYTNCYFLLLNIIPNPERNIGVFFRYSI